VREKYCSLAEKAWLISQTSRAWCKESFPARILTVTPKSAGGTGGHSFTTSGLPSSLPRKDYGSIF